MRTIRGFLFAFAGAAGLVLGLLPAGAAHAVESDLAPPPGPQMSNPTPVGSNWNFYLGTANDPDGGSLTPGDFTVTIDWGDLTPTDVTSGNVNHSGPGDTNWNVNGSHTYAAEGPYTIEVTLSNDAGDSVSWPVSATVSHLFNPCSGGSFFFSGCAQQLSAVEGQAASGILGVFGDTNTSASASDFSATLNWNSSNPDFPYSSTDTNATFVKDGADSTSTVTYFYVEGSHVFPEWVPTPPCNPPFCNGTPPNYGVQVSVGDNLGASLNQSNNGSLFNGVTVVEGTLNVASVTGVSAHLKKAFSQAVATFTDSDPGAMSGDYTATIDWGDGATRKNPNGTDVTPGTVSGPVGGPFTVTGGHIYAAAGSYTVKITVAEADNGATQIVFNDFAAVSRK